MQRHPRLPLAMLGLGLALAACGGSPDGDRVASLSGAGATGATSAPANGAAKDPEQAALAFARCMREHGVDMPDPTDDGGLVVRKQAGQGRSGGPDPGSSEFQAADRACAHHLDAIGKPASSEGRP
jgi:hypothetical protein